MKSESGWLGVAARAGYLRLMFYGTACSRAGIGAVLAVVPVAVAIMMVAPAAAFSQGRPPLAASEPPPPAPPAQDEAPQPVAPAQPPRAENSGLFNEIGKLFDN